jgi:endo-1,4-beta-xylanase
MKEQKLFRKGLLLGSAFAFLLSATQQVNAGQGTDHGFFWSLFVSGGSANITFPNAGQFAGNYAITWNNVGDAIGGKGWQTGSTHSIGYNCGSLTGSFNNFSVYGWTTGPLIEYYICEKGSVATGGVIDTISSDGHNYNFYKHQRINQPSIIGNATFWQYLDNWGGAATGANGKVTTANHITNWKNHGGQGFGSFNYQILATEAFGNKSGSVNATVWGL